MGGSDVGQSLCVGFHLLPPLVLPFDDGHGDVRSGRRGGYLVPAVGARRACLRRRAEQSEAGRRARGGTGCYSTTASTPSGSEARLGQAVSRPDRASGRPLQRVWTQTRPYVITALPIAVAAPRSRCTPASLWSWRTHRDLGVGGSRSGLLPVRSGLDMSFSFVGMFGPLQTAPCPPGGRRRFSGDGLAAVHSLRRISNPGVSSNNKTTLKWPLTSENSELLKQVCTSSKWSMTG